MNNPYARLLLICDAAESFIAESKLPETDEIKLTNILRCLWSAESILDTGRIIVLGEDVSKFEEDKHTVNARMDAIRAEITALMKRMGQEVVRQILEQRARNVGTEWAHVV